MPTNWEQHYETGDMPWEKGEAAPGLIDWLEAHPDYPRRTVLVPGCGTGHDVRAFAHHHFQATGLDLAPSAVRLSQEKTATAKLQADFRLGNFLTDEPFAAFDLIFEHTCFCAIDPSEREAYVRAVLRWLKPDGHLLAVHYFIPDKEGPPFGTNREEIIERFSPHLKLLADWVPRSYPNRTGLERMFWWQRH
jgi:SAM-dependent methyltransferase